MPNSLNAVLALLREQRFGEAGTVLERLLPGAPQRPEIWHWPGFVRMRQGRIEEGQELMRRALRAQPGNTTFLTNLGAALISCGKPAEAGSLLQQALAIQPSLVSAHNNLANALRSLGRIDEAGRHYEAAIALQPNLPEAHNNLGNIRKEQGDIDAALRHYRHALAFRPGFREAFSNLLALTRLSESFTPEEAFSLHRQFSERFEAPLKSSWPAHANTPDPHRRLRIGYVSPDCHPAAMFFLTPVWAKHDPESLDVFAYFDAAPAPDLAPRLPPEMRQRVLAGLPDSVVAQRIRDDGIDVLIDIAGHAGRSRILAFARKPAPVQITWLDYLGTTGLEAMDYRLTDRWADPERAQGYHSERLLHMPDGFCQWCYPGRDDAPAVGPLPASGRDYLMFGSFNNQVKLTPATLELWSCVLRAVPESRLRCIGIDSGQAQERLRAHFAGRGQESRVDLKPRLPYRDFLAACGDVDIALDPLLFSGATTTCDVLWMGLPVVTLPGSSSASRSTASIVSCLGLRRLIAESAEGYVAAAASLAGDRSALSELRGSLRMTMQNSALMDADGFTRALESRLREAWTAWCDRSKGRPA
jgi:predicted O-linked N-acetylglucosamine transferase (SPINDLY family)